MKKFYYIFLALGIALTACEKPATEPEEPDQPKDTTEVPLSEWEVLDTTYTVADWTVPSHTAFKIALTTCAANPTDANRESLQQTIKALVPKTEPYCMVATINGDPHTRMAFNWFTNDGVTDGEVQIVAIEDATVTDFEQGNGVITVPAETTQTKALRYAGKARYIVNASGISAAERYKYIAHKALAENLTPGTAYSWRVGSDGHWSPIGHFRTQDANQGEFSFLVMSDSHIENPTFIKEARRCALAAVKTVPEARFCCFPGDFVEDGDANNSEWEWERWFEESMEPVIKAMPMVVTDGNHDDSPNINYTYHFNTDQSFDAYTTAPQFRGIVYNFVYGDALFYVFSMQDFWREKHSYIDWSSIYLKDHLGAWFRDVTRANPNTKYRISLAHFNLFSGSDHSTDKEPPVFRHNMLPTMKACEIDVALQGHDHTYEVIGPVNPDSCTPILSAISDREEVTVDKNKNVTGYKGGTYCTDDGTFYFIGATCGHKRYYPHSRVRMEGDYTEDIDLLQDDHHHNVKNYFDLFTGMFGQPEAPTFTKVTIKEDCIELNSYTADDDQGNVSLLNTMKIVRTKEHTVPLD
jgi:hypothetical protein